MKNLLIGSIALNVLLFALVFIVKKDATKQAQETVKKQCQPMQDQAKQANDFVKNNNVLWSMIDGIWKSPDRSIAFVKKLADSQKVPRCGGKDCSGKEDEASIKTVQTKEAQGRSVKVGWGSGKTGIKYYFKVLYDSKDKFVIIDADDLLGKDIESDAEDVEEAEAGE